MFEFLFDLDLKTLMTDPMFTRTDGGRMIFYAIIIFF